MALSASQSNDQSLTDATDKLCGWSRLSILLVAIGALIFLRPMLLDPDYYWHLETGRLIVQSRALPDTDPFSFIYAGQHWVLHEWLFQLILYGAYAGFGDIGVRLFCAILGAGTFGIVYGTCRKLSGRGGISLGLILLALFLLFPFLEPRPQIFTLLFFVFFLRALLLAKYCNEMRLVKWLPVMMVAWVNLHGGYAVGLAVVFLFVAIEWFRKLAGSGVAMSRTDLRQMSIVAALCLLACFLNPDGPAHLLYPFEIVSLEATKSLQEWHPVTLETLYGKLYFFYVGLFTLSLIYRKTRPDLTELGLAGIMIALGFSSFRHVPFAILTMIMLASRAIGVGPLIQIPAAAAEWRQRFRSKGSRGKPIGGMEAMINFGACLLLIVGVAAYYPTVDAKHSAMLRAFLPVDTASFMQKHGIAGRMFNSLHFGGYLIHRFRGWQQVFIDGRTDLYGDVLFKEHLDIELGREGWDALLDKYDINIVICRPEKPLRGLLLARGDFALVYEDEAAIVLVKRDAQFQDVIRQFGR